MVSEEAVAPATGVASLYHWYFIGKVPPASALRLTLPPAKTVRPTGSWAIVGAMVGAAA